MMLKGKNIIITGASRGIGRVIALEAAKNGAQVGINFNKGTDEAEILSEEIIKAGCSKPVLLQFDAAKPEEIEGGINSFCSEFDRLDGLVNNAAVINSGLLPVLSEEEIRTQIDSALLGPIFCSRAAITMMMGQKNGCIVNMGSIVTEKTFRGQSIYAAAKGGVLSFTRALAYEYGRKGIRVNCIQPGPVDTGMLSAAKMLAGEDILKQIPLGKYCTSADVANLVIFLLSDFSSCITGACINIDGGYALG